MVIFSSFYNEEYLLPWWLNHHKKIFDHGVLFDYGSTDKSADLIRMICPGWDVRQTRNKNWNFADNDREWMDAEEEFDGYKIVLTTTEFLVGKFPKLWDKDTCYGINFWRVVDDKPWDKPVYEKPLVEQKNTRYIDPRDDNKRRFLHNYKNGAYYVGRHATRHTYRHAYDLWIYKYVYAPWTEPFIQRKLSFKNKMDSRDIKEGKGKHHTWDRDKLEKEYVKALRSSRINPFEE